MKYEELQELIKLAPTHKIAVAFVKTNSFISDPCNAKIRCSISGGADSDIMLDIVHRLDTDKKVHYVFFDTGIEMDAQKRQIKFLEQKYGIEIERLKPKLPVGASVIKHGYPFYSKIFSEYIGRLQKHGFKWEDKPFDELYAEYPKCKAALRWWCNMFHTEGGKFMQSEIGSAPYMKEFMIKNPPTFKISRTCCDDAKKQPAYSIESQYDLVLTGIRKAEGGSRSTSIKNCFAQTKHGNFHYPIFWFSDEDKKEYEKTFEVTHSDAYTVYGCKRTGCAGCPFGSRFENEIEMLEKYEPKLAVGVKNIFSPAHEYMRKYREFKKEMNDAKRRNEHGTVD